MKRIVTYVLLFCMLTGLTACGKKTEETDSKISRPKVELEKKEEEKEQAKKGEKREKEQAYGNRNLLQL